MSIFFSFLVPPASQGLGIVPSPVAPAPAGYEAVFSVPVW